MTIPPTPFPGKGVTEVSGQARFVLSEVTMTDEEIRNLDKEVKKLKRIAGEWAAQLHDLVEERLPAGYEEIPGIAQSTYDACKAWADANAKFKSIQIS